MNDDKIAALTSKQKADVIRRVFKTSDGNLALRILEFQFDCHLPSGPGCGFDTNQTFYRDGHKAVCSEIRNIIAGKWSDDSVDSSEDQLTPPEIP